METGTGQDATPTGRRIRGDEEFVLTPFRTCVETQGADCLIWRGQREEAGSQAHDRGHEELTSIINWLEYEAVFSQFLSQDTSECLRVQRQPCRSGYPRQRTKGEQTWKPWMDFGGSSALLVRCGSRMIVIHNQRIRHLRRMNHLERTSPEELAGAQVARIVGVHGLFVG